MPYAVIATWASKPGEANHVEDLLRQLTPGNRAEPKNIAFHAHRSTDDPDVFVLYEQYTDPSGYEDHKAAEPFQTHVLGDILPRLASREVKTFTTL